MTEDIRQSIVQTYLRTTSSKERRDACNRARYALRKRGCSWMDTERIVQQAIEEAQLAIYYAPLNKERSE